MSWQISLKLPHIYMPTVQNRWKISRITTLEEDYLEVQSRLLYDGWEPFAVDQGTRYFRKSIPVVLDEDS